MGRPGRPSGLQKMRRAGSADPVRRGCHRNDGNRLCGKMKMEGQDHINGTDFGQISVGDLSFAGPPLPIGHARRLLRRANFPCNSNSVGNLHLRFQSPFCEETGWNCRCWQIGIRFAPSALLEMDGLTGHPSRRQIDGGRRPPDGQLSRAPNAATSAYLRARLMSDHRLTSGSVQASAAGAGASEGPPSTICELQPLAGQHLDEGQRSFRRR